VVRPEVVGKVGRARQWGGRTTGWSAEREAVRTHTVSVRCGVWMTPANTPKKRNCDFGYFWLFLVIFHPNIRCNTLCSNNLSYFFGLARLAAPNFEVGGAKSAPTTSGWTVPCGCETEFSQGMFFRPFMQESNQAARYAG